MNLKICHLYGNLMNTYGDNGNLLMLQYTARQLGHQVTTELISLEDPFDPSQYDLVMFGGGQDLEQAVVAKDLQTKKDAIKDYIEDNGVFLGICGGYQLLGHYYINAAGEKLPGISAIDYYTNGQQEFRFIGDIVIEDCQDGTLYEGYENHIGRTYLGPGVSALGKVVSGNGNNGEDGLEGVHYKNVFCSYFHGPLLVRNPHLAQKMVELAINRRQEKEKQ